jgi:tetratricopeptide (TPR) repeat protein
VLALAGWVSLLVGCVEYDSGQRSHAEATRKAALTLGEESGNADIVGWAHEMRAWFALTQGDYRSVIIAAKIGEEVAGGRSVAVQLAGQRAKAWARIGDRRQVELALEQGRILLEDLPYPDNLNNHFVVDPAKFDFYAMDGYRIVGDDKKARLYANEVINSSTEPDGTESKPMRAAEARLTLGLLAARAGDLEDAIALGERALSGDRKSLPSLLMVSSELTDLLRTRFANDPTAMEFVDKVRALSNPSVVT